MKMEVRYLFRYKLMSWREHILPLLGLRIRRWLGQLFYLIWDGDSKILKMKKGIEVKRGDIGEGITEANWTEINDLW